MFTMCSILAANPDSVFSGADDSLSKTLYFITKHISIITTAAYN
jgi:hypothetical protein